MDIDLIPPFHEGIHYRRLDPVGEGKLRWRFKTTRGIRILFKPPHDTHIVMYHDRTGRVWARHDRFGLYIEPGYAWNGCSPKFWVPLLGWVGTPDFKDTILASLIHDVHYQFARCEHFPLHRSDVDDMFRACIEKAGSPRIAEVYHYFVNRYGSWSVKNYHGEFSTLL